MWGLELNVDAAPVVETAIRRGLLVNRTGGTVVRLLPPFIITETEIDRAVDAVFRVDEPAVLDVELQLPPRIDMTAIRTAIPKVTCGRMTERGPSATAESISMPRFIGPGCITIASGFAAASFSGVRP